MADSRLGGDEAAAKDAATGAAAAAAEGAAAGSSVTTATSRKAYLLSLVPNLSLDEIWMLQKRLASLDLRTDIFARLPPELQFMVADRLGPADLGCCLYVSRTWCRSFLHEAMRKDLARRCFPSLLEYVSAVQERAAGSGTDADNNHLVDEIFAETARKYAQRALGRFRYVFRHCRDPPFSILEGAPRESGDDTGRGGSDGALTWWHQERPLSKRQRNKQHEQQNHEWPSAPPPDLLANGEQVALDSDSDDGDDDLVASFACYDYGYGRLAWQCIRQTGTSFLVDDLRNGRRLNFDVPNSVVRGETYLLAGLGNEMIVASTGIRLLAWNFVTGEHQVKQMPSQVDVVTTLGRRICILSVGNIYLWELGGKVQEVDMEGLDAKHRQPDRDGRLPSFFILDPVNEDVFFLGNFDLDTDPIGRNGELCFYVHKFEGLKYKETFSHRLPFENYAFPTCLIEATVRRNARGLYSLASWRVNTGASGLPHSWAHRQVEGIGSLAFNIYTKTFSQSFFRLPPLAPSYSQEYRQVIRMHIWNDQMLTLIDRFRDAPTGKVQRAKPLLFAFDDENGEEAFCSSAKPFSAVPLYTSKPLQDRAEGADALEMEALTLKGRPHIRPECRQKARFDELGPGTPGHWQQDDEDWERNKYLLRFALDVDASPSKAEPLRPAYIGSYHVQGDDDFLVFHHGNEYTVWSFRDDVLENSFPGAS